MGKETNNGKPIRPSAIQLKHERNCELIQAYNAQISLEKSKRTKIAKELAKRFDMRYSNVMKITK